MKCSKKDKIRAITVNVLKEESMEKQKDAMRQVSGQVEDDGDLLDNAVLSSDDSDYEYTSESEARGSNNGGNNDDESDDDDCDLVFKDLDEESDNFSQSGLIVTIRSGRNAGSWKLAFTDWRCQRYEFIAVLKFLLFLVDVCTLLSTLSLRVKFIN